MVGAIREDQPHTARLCVPLITYNIQAGIKSGLHKLSKVWTNVI